MKGRPSGTCSSCHAYPALPRWAKLGPSLRDCLLGKRESPKSTPIGKYRDIWESLNGVLESVVDVTSNNDPPNRLIPIGHVFLDVLHTAQYLTDC